MRCAWPSSATGRRAWTAPPIPPSSMAPRFVAAFSCRIDRHTARSMKPSATSITASIAATTMNASNEPRMCRSKSSPPTPSITVSCTARVRTGAMLLPSINSQVLEMTGAQPFPCCPRVLAEHCEPEVPDEECAEQHGRARDDLFRTVQGLVRVADAHRGAECALGEGHESDGHDREDEDEHRVAPQDAEVMSRHGEDPAEARVGHRFASLWSPGSSAE